MHKVLQWDVLGIVLKVQGWGVAMVCFMLNLAKCLGWHWGCLAVAGPRPKLGHVAKLAHRGARLPLHLPALKHTQARLGSVMYACTDSLCMLALAAACNMHCPSGR